MEEIKARIKKNWKGCLFAALLSAGLGWFFWSGVGQILWHWSYDVPFALRGPIYPSEVAMVYMDEQSHEALSQPYDKPWDRSLHAKLLRKLTAEHARAVVFDIVFYDPGPSPAVDHDFAQAIKDNKRVVLAADYKVENGGALAFYRPNDLFDDAVEGRIGTDVVYHDSDEMSRYQLPCDPRNDVFSTEAWTAAKFLSVPYTLNDSNKFVPFNLNYYGPSGTIPGVNFATAISDDIATNYFSGKVVFIGARYLTKYTGQRKDEYPTPYSYWFGGNFTCGVEIQATAFLNILRHDFLQRLPQRVELALLMGFGLVTGFGLVLLRPLLATLTAILLAVLAFYLNYALFIHFHLWFAWMIMVLAQVPTALTCSVVLNSMQLYVERRMYEKTLGLYLSHKLVKKFVKDPKLRLPGAQKELLTVLFTDIASFTSISERMDPDELARMMNKYFEGAVQFCIFPMDGTVVKYIGDAIFAFWNAPDPQLDHAYRACEAALRLREQDHRAPDGKPLLTRLGLHTGEANVGNFGSMERFDYTAFGENINLASRMEGLNKYLGTRVLLTSDTKDAIDGRLVTRYLGLFRLKGFEKAVGVYELVSRVEDEAASRDLRARFAEALEKFAQRDFPGAASSFQRVLELKSDDGPSKFYLEQIEELRDTEIPAGWKGDITLKDK